MKKHLSVLSLYAYAPMKRAFAVILSMTGLELLFAFLKASGKISYAQKSAMFQLLTADLDRVIFLAAEVLLWAVLARDHVLLKGNAKYSLMRRGTSKFTNFVLNTLANVLYLVLFWIARGVSVILQLRIYESYGVMAAGPQGAFLSLISDFDNLMAMPMDYRPGWIFAALMIAVSAISAAGITAARLKGQMRES